MEAKLRLLLREYESNPNPVLAQRIATYMMRGSTPVYILLEYIEKSQYSRFTSGEEPFHDILDFYSNIYDLIEGAAIQITAISINYSLEENEDAQEIREEIETFDPEDYSDSLEEFNKLLERWSLIATQQIISQGGATYSLRVTEI